MYEFPTSLELLAFIVVLFDSVLILITIDGFMTKSPVFIVLDDDMTPMSDDLALDRVAFDFGFDPLRLDDPAAF